MDEGVVKTDRNEWALEGERRDLIYTVTPIKLAQRLRVGKRVNSGYSEGHAARGSRHVVGGSKHVYSIGKPAFRANIYAAWRCRHICNPRAIAALSYDWIMDQGFFFLGHSLSANNRGNSPGQQPSCGHPPYCITGTLKCGFYVLCGRRRKKVVGQTSRFERMTKLPR